VGATAGDGDGDGDDRGEDAACMAMLAVQLVGLVARASRLPR
jgi:hypothetical protein